MSIPERIRYGATELRSFYNRNLFLALIVSIAFHLAMIGLYLVSTDTVVAHLDNEPRIDSTVIRPLDPPEVKKRESEQKGNGPTMPPVRVTPPTPKVGTTVTNAGPRAAEPTPVPDSLLKPDEGKFASVDQLAFSSPNGNGDSAGSNGTAPNGSGIPSQGGGNGGEGGNELAPKDDIPSDYTDPNVVLPDVDLSDLARRARYPEMARNNGIEGRVTVKVLIDTDGRAIRTSIEQGAGASVLDTAAIRAVRETTFQPATLDGVPVRAWLYVPVTFKLDR